jgi:RNA polymerase sigma-70 factor (ECF subfamily)
LLTVDKLRAGEVHEPERIASFILSTARWSLHSQRRHERRFEPIDQERFGEGKHAGTSDLPIATTQESLVNREWIRGCLESLAERERSVVVLTFFQGCTAQEIAEETGLSPGNVRVVRHRALGLLRHCLGEAHERLSLVHGMEEREQGR